MEIIRSSMLSPYLVMPIFGHILVMHPYDLIKHWRSIDKDDYVTLGRFTSYVGCVYLALALGKLLNERASAMFMPTL